MDVERFYDKYHAFLILVKGYVKGTANDFKSHLVCTNRLFSPLPDKSIDCFAALEDNRSIQSRIDFVEDMIARVQAEQQKSNPVASVGKLKRYVRALKALKEYFESFVPSIMSTSRKPVSSRKQPREKAKRVWHNNTMTPPSQGFDPDCEHVYYDPEALDGQKVPGLAAYLEERYGRIIEFLCGALRPELKEGVYLDRIPVILKQGHPADNYPLDVVKWVLRQWELNHHGLSASEIIQMLKKNGNKFPILGRYFPNENNPMESCIVIYYENSTKTQIEEYFALFEGVLCHEYAHHIHHLYLDRKFLEHNETAKIIKESVADFASFAYLGEYESHEQELGLIAWEKYSGWNKYFGSGWPYAEALWFLHDGGYFPYSCPAPFQSKDKLAEVFRESVDYPTALSILHR